MLWRKFKLDWQYAIGELFIVTAGVLIALWIQQWNDDRLDRLEEMDILDRLLIDLENDRVRLDDMMSSVVEKEESLNRLQSVFDSGQVPDNATRFLEDVVVGANYGWNQAEPRGSTFDEVLSSGKFGLIRDSDLRSAIADYHSLFRSLYVRSDARETEFPHISYQLVPRSRNSDRVGILLSPEANLSEAEIAHLAGKVLSSSLRDYVLAEINLSLFIQRMTVVVQAEHSELVGMIEEYRDRESG